MNYYLFMLVVDFTVVLANSWEISSYEGSPAGETLGLMIGSPSLSQSASSAPITGAVGF